MHKPLIKKKVQAVLKRLGIPDVITSNVITVNCITATANNRMSPIRQQTMPDGGTSCILLI